MLIGRTSEYRTNCFVFDPLGLFLAQIQSSIALKCKDYPIMMQQSATSIQPWDDHTKNEFQEIQGSFVSK